MSRLSLDSVTLCYPDGGGIHKVSSTFSTGELVGVIGANGSGKSTLLKLAAGRLFPESGSVLVDGVSVSAWKARERAQRISYLPQSVEAGLPFTVEELVDLGRGVGTATTVFGSEELFDILGLTGLRTTPLPQLSGGERRRAFIAMVLAQGAKTILLDEPLAGLDLRYQYELLDLLRELCHQHGLTIVVSLHELLLARGLDRVLVLHDGKVTGDGLPVEVLTDLRIRQTFDLSERFAIPSF